MNVHDTKAKAEMTIFEIVINNTGTRKMQDMRHPSKLTHSAIDQTQNRSHTNKPFNLACIDHGLLKVLLPQPVLAKVLPVGSVCLVSQPLCLVHCFL